MPELAQVLAARGSGSDVGEFRIFGRDFAEEVTGKRLVGYLFLYTHAAYSLVPCVELANSVRWPVGSSPRVCAHRVNQQNSSRLS